MRKLIILCLFGALVGNGNDSLNKASAAMRAGMYKEALSHISDAQIMDRSNPDIYRMEALLHETLEDFELALAAWKNCLKYSKDEFISSEAKVHIQNLSTE
jgi:tetratricopeptide (TPR) repeat protein